MRWMRIIATAALALLVGCGQPVKVARAPVAPPPIDPRPAFERMMDAYGVPFAPPRSGKAILVNIPSYEAIAFEDGEVALRSRVIVGSVKNPTPVMDTHVSVVRYRPTWRPTSNMIENEGYEDKLWPPGRRNPLGLAAIRLEPGLLIYLHDTNRRDLYARERRALSHGCIRTEEWDQFAAWLLDKPLSEVRAHAEGRRTFDAESAPVPVMIRYYTSFPDARGVLREHADVYRRGRTILTPERRSHDIAGAAPPGIREAAARVAAPEG